jgi:hypothetical protein
MPDKKTGRTVTINPLESQSAISEQQMLTVVSGTNDGVEVSTPHGALLFIMLFWSTLGISNI